MQGGYLLKMHIFAEKCKNNYGMNLYPLKFKPLFVELIWGGDKLGKVLNKPVGSAMKVGESWEISDIPGKETKVLNGQYAGHTLQELIISYGSDFLGSQVTCAPGGHFPLLIKFIDAADNLSIQVHPDDEVAAERHGSAGKNEMWYIMEHEPGAKLVAGFKRALDKEQFVKQAEEGTIEESLNYITVESGDVFYIPAGRVHAIGKGILLAEIQQSSDVTYRIYDYKRKDVMGNERELHLAESVDVVNLQDLGCSPIREQAPENTLACVVDSLFFTTQVMELKGSKAMQGNAGRSFLIGMVLTGDLEVCVGENKERIIAGETFLLPAAVENYHLKGEAKLLFVSC